MPTYTVVLRVDFPGLTDLVAYLRDTREQQRQIDALTSKVAELTKGLRGSTTSLDQAIKENQK